MPLQEQMTNDVRLPLLLLSVAVGVVLLVACVNLAGLLLARAGRRTREIATRLAVGGDRRAVMRQLLIESLVLAVCGGAGRPRVSAPLALEGLKATADRPAADAVGHRSSLDARVLSVTLGLTTLTAILFGLVPAIQATRLDVQARWPKAARDRWPAARRAGRAGCWWSPRSRSASCCWSARAC